jgi:hypothetical protein
MINTGLSLTVILNVVTVAFDLYFMFSCPFVQVETKQKTSGSPAIDGRDRHAILPHGEAVHYLHRISMLSRGNREMLWWYHRFGESGHPR